MKAYLIALAVGLLGILIGEHVFGPLPSRPGAQATALNPAEPPADLKPETAA
jgi:hypothetical protein